MQTIKYTINYTIEYIIEYTIGQMKQLSISPSIPYGYYTIVALLRSLYNNYFIMVTLQ